MKTAFRVMSIVSFGVVIGVVGGMEHGSISLLAGTVASLFALGAMAVFAKLGGIMY